MSVLETVATALIPGLDEIVRNGDPKRRAEAAFDGVLTGLVPHTEIAARADLAERLSLLANAPRMLVGQLARENEILIAGPLLRRSPVINEVELIEIARAKGQGHLLAMAERPKLSPDLTDVIVRRGDREVVRRAAGNAGAQFSQVGYSSLIKRAGQDGVLTLKIGQRDDLSDAQLKHLLEGPEKVESRRDFVPAQRTILALHKAGALNEAALLGFAKAHQHEESVAALSAMSGVKIATLDRLISGDRHDPILIVGKTIGLEWATVRALILLRLGPNRVPAPADIESARVNFARLMPSTAERVVNFWQTRQSA